MKRAQVFKKTLLSVAVVTALGSNIGLSYGAYALESMKINDAYFQYGVKQSFWVDVDGQVVAFGQTDEVSAKIANDMRSVLVTKKAEFEQAIAAFKQNNNYSAKEQAVNAAEEAWKAAEQDEKEVRKRSFVQRWKQSIRLMIIWL